MKLFKTIATIGLIGTLTLTPVAAKAGDLCDLLGEVAQVAAEGRDRGDSLHEMLEYWNISWLMHPTKLDDTKGMLHFKHLSELVVLSVYKKPYLTPMREAVRVVERCNKVEGEDY